MQMKTITELTITCEFVYCNELRQKNKLIIARKKYFFEIIFIVTSHYLLPILGKHNMFGLTTLRQFTKYFNLVPIVH